MENPWNDYTNETLIHLHKKIRTQRKMYQRASDFYDTFYSIFGLITVLTSTVASTLSWGGNGKEMDENKKFILSIITTTSALSAAIQNFYNFKENSNKLIETSKTYSKLQNRLENIGNIHPDYREENPYELFKLIDIELDKLTENRKELSSCLTKYCFTKKCDCESYLEAKHENYKLQCEEEKKSYCENEINA
tara:strand:- start:749 stop:1327 length:579 start_codon:yes stop_codon:yes gene_type:complete